MVTRDQQKSHRFRQMSIRGQLTVFMACLLVVSLIFLIMMIYTISRRRIDLSLQTAESRTDFISEDLVNYYNRLDRLNQELSTNRDVQLYLRLHHLVQEGALEHQDPMVLKLRQRTLQSIQGYLSTMVTSDPTIKDLAFYDGYSDVLAKTGDINYATITLLKEQGAFSNKPYISSRFQNPYRTSKINGIMLVSPIVNVKQTFEPALNDDQDFLGYLLTWLSTDRLDALLEARRHEDAILVMHTPDGEILAQSSNLTSSVWQELLPLPDEERLTTWHRLEGLGMSFIQTRELVPGAWNLTVIQPSTVHRLNLWLPALFALVLWFGMGSLGVMALRKALSKLSVPVTTIREALAAWKEGRLEDSRTPPMRDPFIPVPDDPDYGSLVILINERLQEQADRARDLKVLQDEMYSTLVQKELAEFYALRQQMSPHFIYNAFEAIRVLAVLNQQDLLAELVVSTAAVFRYQLGSREWWAVTEELAIIDEYMKVMMMRFPKRITWSRESANHTGEIYHLNLYSQIVQVVEMELAKGHAEIEFSLRVHIEQDSVVYELTVKQCDRIEIHYGSVTMRQHPQV